MSRLKPKKISELVDIFNNVRIPLSKKEREPLEKTFPYYGAQGIVDYVDGYLFNGEYILVAEDGENLRSNNQNICNLVKGKFWVNNHAHILKANALNDNKYLFYNFNRIKFEPYVTGSAQPKLNKENLLNIKTYVHNLEDQQKIALTLSSLDDKIDLNNKINDNLEAMAKTIYDYWFVQFDFPNENGKPYKSSGGKMVWNEVLKREIPEGWEVNNLDKCIDKIIDYRGRTPKKLESEWSEKITDIIAISAKHIKKGKLVNLENANRIDETLYSKWMKEKLLEGDILMTSEAPCGEFFYLIGDVKYCLSQRVFAIRANSQYINHCCLYFELSFGNGYSQIMGKVSGSTVLGIRQDELRTVNILIPITELQNVFSKINNSIYKRVRNNESQNQQLSSLRDWLLPMLMNGQVKIEDKIMEKV